MLFLEGEYPVGVYILYSGGIDLLFSARNGSVKPLRIAQPGRILGLSAVVLMRQHGCSATTRTGCDVGFIGRDELLGTLDEDPEVWLSVLRILSSDVEAAYNDIRALAAA